MTLNKFITKLLVKGLIIVLLIFIMGSVLPSVGTLITNEMALTQMENSNDMFVLMNAYSTYQPVVSGILKFILVLVVATIGCDTYNFINFTENKKEN